MKSKILSRHFIPSPVKSNEEIVLEVLIRAIRDLISKNHIKAEKIVGCGIGVSGLVNQKEGTLVFSKILGWKKIRFKEFLEKEFDFPIFIDKDVNVLTLAEKRFGVGKK